jgi:hypothetical protein
VGNVPVFGIGFKGGGLYADDEKMLWGRKVGGYIGDLMVDGMEECKMKGEDSTENSVSFVNQQSFPSRGVSKP